jgi:predicted phosphodiesterase
MKYYLTVLALFLNFSSLFCQDLKIGLIADCQYCNCDFNTEWNNDYRKGFPRLKTAVDSFNSTSVNYAFHLGDFIDRDFESYQKVIPVFEQLKMPHHHVLGNHDYKVNDSLKSSVLSTLNLENPYYTITKNDWVFIVLDGTDISTYKSNDSLYFNQSEQIRLDYLSQGRTQAMPWNGAIGKEQMTWLDSQLNHADENNLNAVILCHFPVYPKNDANLWNDIEVMQLLEKHKSVKAYINGHHHPGNYAIHNNIHYLTLQGMVLTNSESAFAIITLLENKIVVDGFGREPDRVLEF